MRGLLQRSLIVAFVVSALTTLALGLLYIFTDPAALLNLANLAYLLVMFFIPVFLGCVWLGLWQERRAGRPLSGPRGVK